MAVNVKGEYLFSRALLKPMIRREMGISWHRPLRLRSDRGRPVHYAAFKAALRCFREALAHEAGRYQIAVNVVEPSLLDVGFARRLPKRRIGEYLSQCSLGRLGKAEDIAESIAWLVSSENTSITGARVVPDGGV